MSLGCSPSKSALCVITKIKDVRYYPWEAGPPAEIRLLTKCIPVNGINQVNLEGIVCLREVFPWPGSVLLHMLG